MRLRHITAYLLLQGIFTTTLGGLGELIAFRTPTSMTYVFSKRLVSSCPSNVVLPSLYHKWTMISTASLLKKTNRPSYDVNIFIGRFVARASNSSYLVKSESFFQHAMGPHRQDYDSIFPSLEKNALVRESETQGMSCHISHINIL